MVQPVSKGAPLDVAYINDLANSVINLEKQMNTSPYKRTTVNNSLFGNNTSSPTSVRTSDARIHAEVFTPTGGASNNSGNTTTSTIDAGTKLNFTIPLQNFDSPPIITATPIITTASIKPALSVVISSISRDAVVGYVHVHESITNLGQNTIAVSMIAIGLPTNTTGTATSSPTR